MSFTVTDNPEESRYELRDGDTLVGFAAYRLRRGTIVFTHTEVADEYEGQGAGSQLAREALDDSPGAAGSASSPAARSSPAGSSGIRTTPTWWPDLGRRGRRVRASQSRPSTGSTRGTKP